MKVISLLDFIGIECKRKTETDNFDGTLNLLFVTLYWVSDRDRGSVRVRVLELSFVNSIFSGPKIDSQTEMEE